MIAVAVTDTINVTIQVTAATAPVDKESDSELSNSSDPVYTYIRKLCICKYI